MIYKLFFILFLLSSGCSRNFSNFRIVGGICGDNTLEEFKNPLANENLDLKTFAIIDSGPEQSYVAKDVTLFVKKKAKELF